MEHDPKFQIFLEAIYQNAVCNPDQLKNLEVVWDKEWDELLTGVDGEED